MENIQLKIRKASFTVEAVFVVTIVIWIVAAICYLSVYSHDEVALYTLTQNFLELAAENGKQLKESEVQIGLREYLEEHLILSRMRRVGVKEKPQYFCQRPGENESVSVMRSYLHQIICGIMKQ